MLFQGLPVDRRPREEVAAVGAAVHRLHHDLRPEDHQRRGHLPHQAGKEESTPKLIASHCEPHSFSSVQGQEFPAAFTDSHIRKIHRLLFHVLAHVYHAHFREIVLIQVR